MICFALLVPLAATSNALALRHLGGRRWQELHRTVYAIAILAVLHYAWMVKADIRTPLLYALAVAILLGARAAWRLQERRRQLAGAYARKPVRRIVPIAVRK